MSLPSANYGSVRSTDKTECHRNDGNPSMTKASDASPSIRPTVYRRFWIVSTLLTIIAVVVVVLVGVGWYPTDHVSTELALPRSEELSSIPMLGMMTSDTSSLSKRGQSVKAVRDDIPMFMAGLADPYHPVDNTDGYLVMLVAENKLMWHEMAAKIQHVQSTTTLPEWIFTYGSMTGQADFCAAMAKVFQKWIRQGPVDAQYVKVQAGAGSVLAQLSYLLGDPSDGVLVTAPNYPAFAGDFGIYGGMKLHTIQATAASASTTDNFVPTTAHLNEAYQRAADAGNPPRILIICQPNNPTGTLYSADTMRRLITWALDRGLHVVSDEIYALSVFPGIHTTSAADIMYELSQSGKESSDDINDDDETADDGRYLGDYVHIVAGLSKDWGMSGFRVGTLFSHNTKLLQALDLIGYYPAVSQYTQHVLTHVMADDAWMDWYIGENQQRLWDTYQALVAALERIQVPVIPAQGALFAWVDFSAYLLPGQTEKELWSELFKSAKILFTTGESCHENKPGMFRVVYPCPEGGPIAMKELGDRLVRWKQQREQSTL